MIFRGPFLTREKYAYDKVWGIPEPGEGCYLDAFNHTLKTPKRRRRPLGPNEGRAMHLMRRHNWSLNLIGECLGRSTDFVSRHLHGALDWRHNHQNRRIRWDWMDLRKLPGTIKRHIAQIQRSLMLKLQLPYLLFAKGEADEPP